MAHAEAILENAREGCWAAWFFPSYRRRPVSRRRTGLDSRVRGN